MIRVNELVILQAERSAEDRTERYGPVQQYRRMVTSLNKQIQQKTKELEEVILRHVHTHPLVLKDTDGVLSGLQFLISFMPLI